jgi:hypothetical protein
MRALAAQEAVLGTFGVKVQEPQGKETQEVSATNPYGQEVAAVLEVRDLHILQEAVAGLVQFLHWLLRHMAPLVLQQVDGLQAVVQDMRLVLRSLVVQVVVEMRI